MKGFVLWLCVLSLWTVIPDVTRAEEYRLVLGKGTAVCDTVLNLYNERVLTDAQDPGDTKAPDLSKVEWREMKHRASSFLTGREGSISHALVDLDNDGKMDWVVKWRGSLSAELSDELHIYRNQQSPLEPVEGFGVEHLQRSEKDIIAWGGNSIS